MTKEVLAEPMIVILNQKLVTGCFPNKLKLAQ